MLDLNSMGTNRKTPKQGFWYQVRSIAGIVLIAFFIRTFFYGLYQVPTPSMENTMLVGERFLADKLTVCFKDPINSEIVTLNQPTFKYANNWFKNVWQRYVGVSIGANGIDWGPSNWTKRVIGIPGDELKGVLEEGKPVIYIKKAGQADFTKLDEPYLNQYPVIATYKSDRSDPFTYRSWDRTKPLNKQPFYQFNKQEIDLGRIRARDYYGDRAVKDSATPYISVANKHEQPWLTGEVQNGLAILDEFHVKLEKNQYWLMGDNRLASHDSRAWGPVNKQLIHGKIKFRIWSLDSDSSWWIFELIKHPIAFWQKVRWSRCFQVVK
jgi:signal peptidase I